MKRQQSFSISRLLLLVAVGHFTAASLPAVTLQSAIRRKIITTLGRGTVMAVRALVVEDEAPSRRILRDFAVDVDWLHIIGEATDGRVAVEMIDRLQPDLVFLDIQLPKLTGLQLLERVQYEPAIVFTTAYD